MRLAAILISFALAAPAAADVLIKNVTLIDGTGRPALKDVSVLVVGEKIAEVREGRIKAPPGFKSSGATVIDGKGKFLIPGLWDTHVHLEGGRVGAMGTDRKLVVDKDTGRRMLHGYLYSGVTGIYDAGNYDKFIFTMRDDERSGRMLSPRIFATGHLITRDKGYAASGGGAGINTVDEGKAALDRLMAQKPDLIKFAYARKSAGDSEDKLPGLDADIMRQLILYANEHGFPTTVHAVELATQREAVHAGIDALAHPVYMTETDDNLAHLIAAKGLVVSTSLVVLQNIARVANDPTVYEDAMSKAVMAPQDYKFFRDAESGRYRAMRMDKWAEQALAMASRNVKKLYDAGATLALGTDRTLGPTVHGELELVVAAGIPPLEAIRIGTLNAAKYVRRDRDLGSIEAGKYADMVLLDADPLADIRNSRTINTVIKGGQVVDRAKLDIPLNQAK